LRGLTFEPPTSRRGRLDPPPPAPGSTLEPPPAAYLMDNLRVFDGNFVQNTHIVGGNRC